MNYSLYSFSKKFLLRDGYFNKKYNVIPASHSVSYLCNPEMLIEVELRALIWCFIHIFSNVMKLYHASEQNLPRLFTYYSLTEKLN